MKSVLILTFTLFFSGTEIRSQSVQLKTHPVLSGKVTMLIPSEFSLMGSERLAIKYPIAGHRPAEVYTNENGSINIALNHTTNKAQSEDLPDVRKTMESQFSRAPFTFIKSELKDLYGSKTIILEFVSPAADAWIYNLMAIFIFESRLVMITFNCTEDQRKQWEPYGKKMINSITFKN